MKNLYIFGNGFDRRHGIPCSYNDFRNWLDKKRDFEEKPIFEVPSYYTNYKRIETYDEKGFANFYISLFDEVCCDDDGNIDWCDFENAIGRINWGRVVDEAGIVYDKDGDPDPFNAGNNYVDMAELIAESSHVLNKLFEKWVQDIEDKINSNLYLEEFSQLNNDDVFITFNYTSTLETVYGIKHVNHLHGYVNNYEELVVGHGSSEFNDTYFKDNDLAIFAEDAIERVFERYRKDTSKVILSNRKLFESLSEITDIYILGVSLNKIDEPYLKVILDSVKDECNIHINIYEEATYNVKRDYILSLGKNKRIKVEKWLMK